MVWDRRTERDAGPRDRHAGAAHSCDAGRCGGPAQPGREWFGALERKSGAVRRSHAPRLRALPRYRQNGKAQARVTNITAAALTAFAQAPAARLPQKARHREKAAGLVGAEAFPLSAFDGGGGGGIEFFFFKQKTAY